jgi:hypothetical protein
MTEENLLVKAGYSAAEKRNLGYIVNAKKAFDKVLLPQ